MTQAKRICLYGGPGVGKSTLAARLYADLKSQGHNIELVTEWIKTWAYENRAVTPEDQVYVFAQQRQREWDVLKTGTCIITDSPLFLQLVYAKRAGVRELQSLEWMAASWETRYPTKNFILLRQVPYVKTGRFHTEEQSQEIDRETHVLLRDQGLSYSFLSSLTDTQDLTEHLGRFLTR